MTTPRLALITASLALLGSILATPAQAAAMATTEISPTLPTIAAQIAGHGAYLELAKRGRSGTGVEDKDRGGEDEANDVCDPTDDNDDDCVTAAAASSMTLAKRGRGRSGTGVEDGDRGGEDEPNDVCDPSDDNDDDCA